MTELHQLDAVERMIDIFDTVGIVYAIGGSIASSFHGAMRYTQDADIAAKPFSPLADQFFGLAKNEFYVSEQAMRNALNSGSSFNVIHFETAFKIDIFVLGPGEFERHLLERRQRVRLGDASRRDVCVVSAEDIILLKLRWFRATECTSQQQWADLLGVLRVQQPTLDFDYLAASARQLALQELLNRALAEARTWG